MTERPFAFMMLKPMGINEPLRGEVLGMVKQVAEIKVDKRRVITQEEIEAHYRQIAGSPHFSPITRYLAGKMVEVMIVEGEGKADEFIRQLRDLVGKSDPQECRQGQIRHLAIEHGLNYIVPMEIQNGSNGYCRDNLIHCSDSPQAAKREVVLWFDDMDVLWRYGR